MTVTGVAVQAGFPHAGRTKALEGLCGQGYVAFKEHLSMIEGAGKALLRDCGGLVFVTTFGNVVGGSQFSARIPLCGREISHRLSHVFGIGFLCRWRRGVFFRLTSSHGKGRDCQKSA